MTWRALLLGVSLLLHDAAVAPSQTQPAADTDGDGIADELEQAILERFAPRFMVSAEDCDGLPSVFLADSRQPRAGMHDGTIYGQVSRSAVQARNGQLLEVHYYHLWGRDCGRMAHELDVEHVSALIEGAGLGDRAGDWQARYWYASAHQNTLCDVSHGARADALSAVSGGPSVWISRGKHASYLDVAWCDGGCGGDRCERMIPLPAGPILNIGEPALAMNGAVWTGSTAWPLAAKMRADFSDEAIQRLESADAREIIELGSSRPRVRRVIGAGGASVDAVASGQQHTGAALTGASDSTERAIDKGAGEVGKSLTRARRSVAKALRAIVGR